MTFQTTQTKYFLKAYDTHYPLTHQPATYHPFWPIRPETQNQPNLTFYPLYSVFYVNEHIYQGWAGRSIFLSGIICRRNEKVHQWNLQSVLPRFIPRVLSISQGGAGQGLLFVGRVGRGEHPWYICLDDDDDFSRVYFFQSIFLQRVILSDRDLCSEGLVSKSIM